jgi:hypothetical protein
MPNLTIEGCALDVAGLGLQAIMYDQPVAILTAVDDFANATANKPEYQGDGMSLFMYLYARTCDEMGACNEWGPTMIANIRKLRDKVS